MEPRLLRSLSVREYVSLALLLEINFSSFWQAWHNWMPNAVSHSLEKLRLVQDEQPVEEGGATRTG